MSPVPVIAHIAAVIAGVWGGLTMMDAIAPDRPEPERTAQVRIEPGHSVADHRQPKQVQR